MTLVFSELRLVILLVTNVLKQVPTFYNQGNVNKQLILSACVS